MVMGTTKDEAGRADPSARTKRPVPSEGGRESTKQQHIAYQPVPFPKTQQTIATALRSTEHKHVIHMLTEVYVIVPRQVTHE